MNSINTDTDDIQKRWNPLLVSSGSDLSQLPGEDRLRKLAISIPSHSHKQLISTTQSCIFATIHSTQEYLCQIVSGLFLSDPGLCSMLTVSASGLDAISWVDRTENEYNGWIPNCIASGYINFGRLDEPPHYGRSPLENTITLSVMREDEEADDCEMFSLVVSVAFNDDMKLLANFINDTGETWDEFEALYNITPFTSIPLPDEAEDNLPDKDKCRDYINAFVDNIVVGANKDDCLETIDLEFRIDQKTPLQYPIVAAIALLNALLVYEAMQNQNENNYISMAINKLEPALIAAKWRSRNSVSNT